MFWLHVNLMLSQLIKFSSYINFRYFSLEFYSACIYNPVWKFLTFQQTIDTSDDAFWDQFWSGTVNNISDIFALVTAEDIHTLREESPANFMTLIYKVIKLLVGRWCRREFVLTRDHDISLSFTYKNISAHSSDPVSLF